MAVVNCETHLIKRGNQFFLKQKKGWVSKFLGFFPFFLKSSFAIIQLPVLCLGFGLDTFFNAFIGASFLPIRLRVLSQLFLITSLIIVSVFIHSDNTPTTSTSIHHSKEITKIYVN